MLDVYQIVHKFQTPPHEQAKVLLSSGTFVSVRCRASETPDVQDWGRSVQEVSLWDNGSRGVCPQVTEANGR